MNNPVNRGADTRPFSTFRSVCLTGYMGAGKTSVGRALSGLLNMPFVDLDGVIETTVRMPVHRFFTEYGENAFRRVETLLLEDALGDPKHAIIALGGGVITMEQNRDLLLSEKSLLVYLVAPVEELWRRCTAGREAAQIQERPLLAAGEAAFHSRFQQREPLYRAAHIHIDTLGHTVEETAGLTASKVMEFCNQENTSGAEATS